jgi:IMP dehydrogenase
VSIGWQLDAYQFAIPCVAHPSDAIMSPATAAGLGRLGGLGVLNAEGLWTRYEDPSKLLAELAGLADPATTTRRLHRLPVGSCPNCSTSGSTAPSGRRIPGSC